MNYDLLLGTQSPRRHQIFREAGFSFNIVNCEVDESWPSSLSAEEVPMYLSELKSQSYDLLKEDQILVTADTVVVINGELLNKPLNELEAKKMLEKLSDSTQTVYTGVTLRSNQSHLSFIEETQVEFYPLKIEIINKYIADYKPFDKAGAYGVQDYMGYYAVKAIRGCFYNVMGFPMSRFFREYEKFI